MAVTTPYVVMQAQNGDTQPVSLTKIVAWLTQLATDGVVGNNGDSAASSAGSPTESQVVKASAGVLYSVRAYNNIGSTIYLQVFDAAAVPADGATPTLAPRNIAANSWGDIDLGVGRKFTNGISLAASSTPTVLTRTGGVMFDAVYR